MFDVRVILAALVLVGFGFLVYNVTTSDAGYACEVSMLNGNGEGCK